MVRPEGFEPDTVGLEVRRLLLWRKGRGLCEGIYKAECDLPYICLGFYICRRGLGAKFI